MRSVEEEGCSRFCCLAVQNLQHHCTFLLAFNTPDGLGLACVSKENDGQPDVSVTGLLQQSLDRRELVSRDLVSGAVASEVVGLLTSEKIAQLVPF